MSDAAAAGTARLRAKLAEAHEKRWNGKPKLGVLHLTYSDARDIDRALAEVEALRAARDDESDLEHQSERRAYWRKRAEVAEAALTEARAEKEQSQIEWEDAYNLMRDVARTRRAALEQAQAALELICDEAGRPLGGGLDGVKDQAWCAGVAMGALAAIKERSGGLGECAWHPGEPFTMALKLCDDDGTVRSGRFFKGTEYPCTGGAHFAGEHIRCTSPAHARAALAGQTTDTAAETGTATTGGSEAARSGGEA